MGWRTALAALGIGLAQQVVLTIGGQIAPDASQLYGAPLPVGSGMDLIGFSSGSFEFAIWIVNVVITAAIVWLLALVLRPHLWRGLLVVAVVTLAGLVIAGAGYQFQLLGWQVRQLDVWYWSQLIIWLLGVAAVATLWATRARPSA